VLGTVLLAFDLKRLVGAFYPLVDEAGQLRLEQKFANGTSQVMYQRGTADSNQASQLDSGNPNWLLYFTPGPAYASQVAWLSIGLMVLAALAALAGAWVAISLTFSHLQRQVDADARQLAQLLQELSGGKAVKAFGLGLASLNGLAQSLARFSLREGSGTAAPPAAGAAIPGVRTSSAPASAKAGSQAASGAIATSWISSLRYATMAEVEALDCAQCTL